MTRETYIEKRFSPASLAVIEKANEIIDDYQAQGFTLTLRQLYYQFVSRDLLANKQENYDRLGSIINDARLAGLVDWEAIEDRTRNVRTNSHWDGPGAIVAACAAQFRVDLWADQETIPEVWIEKDALIGVIEGVCRELDVPYFACRGYNSQSEQWRAGVRARDRWNDQGQRTVILHFGDHDPSGIDMTRDNLDRLTMFCPDGLHVERLALNMPQVKRYRPPPNPAKMSDSRASDYVAKFGASSWELDALEPSVIVALVREAVEGLIDDDKWDRAQKRQADGRAALKGVVEDLAKRWK